VQSAYGPSGLECQLIGTCVVTFALTAWIYGRISSLKAGKTD
jgi:hypothetical protein